MYAAHFNLREPPFSIAPDPAFLYMSSRHQEALGHLLYGTGQYGGFVQLTGEVGTGKTTIIRTLLVQKLDHVDVAMIHNPRQSELEFVASICDELGVPYAKPAGSIKALVDALNDYLLRAHAGQRRTVLIIDEAQNLEPAVLEQVRLLTNLETDKEKLLRIMLVGQPELIDLLARPDLRQLASRITARYHLTPLSPAETSQYIIHRLRVAGGAADLFSDAAMRRVHRYARGIPRLVNIICDRALLGAYAKGLRTVTPDIVDRAAVEALGPLPETARRRWLRWPRRLPLGWIESALAVAALAVAVVVLWEALSGSTPAHPAAGKTAPPAAAAPPQAPAAAAGPAAAPAPTPAAASAAPAADSDAGAAPIDGGQGALRASAEPLRQLMARLIGLWDARIVVPGGRNICEALAEHHLQCYTGTAQWSELAKMNRPAILTLDADSEQPQYVLLRRLDGEAAVLQTGQGALRVPLAQLTPLWSGQFLLLWRRETAELFVGPQSRGASVVWVRQRLARAAGKPVPLPVSAGFDAALAEELKRFQARHGLQADGVAGIRTLMALSDVLPPAGTPTLESGG